MDRLDFSQGVKGNPHAHSNRSDGDYSVKDLANLYKEKGYHVLGITDHRIYYDHENELEGMIILSGCEYNCYLDHEKFGRIEFHLLTLKSKSQVDEIPDEDNSYKSLFYTKVEEVQEFIEFIRGKGNLVFIAHPKHPFIPLEIMLQLDFDGMEVYNHKARSDATDYIYPLYKAGKCLRLLASDDSHCLYGPLGEEMLFSGFVCFETDEDIRGQLVKSRFYASMGPVIEAIEWTDQRVCIQSTCDNVKIIFYKASEQVILSERESQIPKEALAFRVECLEGDKKAWSNIYELR